MRGRRRLVAGGAGYIAAHIVRALSVSDREAVVIHDLSTAHVRAAEKLEKSPRHGRHLQRGTWTRQQHEVLDAVRPSLARSTTEPSRAASATPPASSGVSTRSPPTWSGLVWSGLRSVTSPRWSRRLGLLIKGAVPPLHPS